MSQEVKQPLKCPECKTEILCKMFGTVVGGGVEVVCQKCEHKYRFILTENGWERLKMYD